MRKEIIVPAVAVIGGGVGFALRRWGLDTGFEPDTGLPIPEEDLPRIWEPYFKGDAARRGGSGLGLSIVAAAARDHGWRWEAANSDGGVTFTIRFNA